MPRTAASLFATFLLLVVLALLVGLPGCATVPDGKVAYCPPASLPFEAPVPLGEPSEFSTKGPAREMFPYAAMSTNVYWPFTAGKASGALSPDALNSACQPGSSNPVPVGTEWKLVEGFPIKADELDEKVNLRVQLWVKKPAPAAAIDEVVVVFRGTELRHGKDWYSNLRWLIPLIEDHYTKTIDTVVPNLRTWLDAELMAGRVARDARLVATGHSLGGGLAQQLAYAFRAPETLPTMRVDHVYAFDPSPVTGWARTDEKLREHNADGLMIDRILEDGEILSYLRTFLGVFVKPSEKRPTIRGVKFNFKHSLNPFSNHSVRLIACSLAKFAGEAPGLDTVPLEQELKE